MRRHADAALISVSVMSRDSRVRFITHVVIWTVYLYTFFITCCYLPAVCHQYQITLLCDRCTVVLTNC